MTLEAIQSINVDSIVDTILSLLTAFILGGG